MAEAPGHKLGQIIGEVLEQAIEPLLTDFATKHLLYLDRKGPRGVRPGAKLTWTDSNGNAHDLDFVIERGGSDTTQGTPVAFIETAWRRYAKHSRNKAQEIQGAILPLFETYRMSSPFIGAVLAGVFTEGALTQLRSYGFTVLYFPYRTVLSAFAQAGIDISFSEGMADSQLSRKVHAWKNLSQKKKYSVPKALIRVNRDHVNEFMESLRCAVTRRIQNVRILPLFGTTTELSSVAEAISFIEQYDEQFVNDTLVRYEVQVLYANGDRIEGHFADKREAISFLQPFSIDAEGSDSV